MSRRAVLLVLAVAAAALVALGARHAIAGDGPPPAGGVVERVVDGDTVIVRADGGALRVRLLGIDTPETVDPHRPVGCFGPQASAFSKRLLAGGAVDLEYDRELHDRYGRWLAYIYLRRSGRPPLFVNAVLVARGFARTLSIPPNTAHAGQLSALERSAALAGRGLWSACE
jgi:micrococcal nuclease